MLRAPLRYAYRRLGARYPRFALAVQFQFAHVVVFGGVALLWLYVDMTAGEFGRIVAVTQAITFVDNLLGTRSAWRLVRPADPWLRGDRDGGTATAAFGALAGLPSRFLRTRGPGSVVLSVLPGSAYVVWELDQPAVTGLLVIGAAGTVILLYGALLRFLAIELILRPVLERVSDDLPADAELHRATVPLLTRLLLTLPAINIVTGVVVSGLADPGQDGLRELGLGVLLAVAVAFTLSFELALLLARSIVEPLRDLREGADRVAAGDLDVRVPVLGTDEAGRLAMSFNAMVAGLRERAALHGAMGAFVDPQVADRVVSDGRAEIAGEEVDVTIVFVDIRGFTSFAERSTPTGVVAELDAFFATVVPVITGHGGHVNKFLGDGLLAVFGAPSPLPDHPDRAVAAAVALVRAVDERFGDRLRVGVGVHGGTVVAGTIGGGGRIDFTVIGDVVNTAARVEGATRETGDDVLVTATTAGRLRADHGGFVERDPIRLRGKRDPVAVLAPAVLVGRRHGPGASVATPLPRA